jgi:hypothetical protein
MSREIFFLLKFRLKIIEQFVVCKKGIELFLTVTFQSLLLLMLLGNINIQSHTLVSNICDFTHRFTDVIIDRPQLNSDLSFLDIITKFLGASQKQIYRCVLFKCPKLIILFQFSIDFGALALLVVLFFKISKNVGISFVEQP